MPQSSHLRWSARWSNVPGLGDADLHLARRGHISRIGLVRGSAVHGLAIDETVPTYRAREGTEIAAKPEFGVPVERDYVAAMVA